MEVTDKSKTIAYYEICQSTLRYESAMFYREFLCPTATKLARDKLADLFPESVAEGKNRPSI